MSHRTMFIVFIVFTWVAQHDAKNQHWCPKPAVLDAAALPYIDELTPLIDACMPIVYLEAGETAYPMPVEEYFLHSSTRLLERGTNRVIIPAGEMSLARLDALTREFWKAKKHLNDVPYYIDVQTCVLAGADPLRWADSTGTLTVPAYVLVAQGPDPELTYLQCIFFYGYNAPYEIAFGGVKLFSGDKYDFQNAHEADVEHITIEVHTKTSTIKRIFYGSHGSNEGMWVDVSEIEMENGHPIVYVARGGHGNYPRVGTWVRILGFANDITGKDVRWTPQWRRVFMPYLTGTADRSVESHRSDERYVAALMGWLLAPALYGKRGVSPLWSQWWFGNPKENMRTLRDGLKLFCPKGNNECIRKKAPDAQIPGGNPKELELIIAVWKAANTSEQFAKDTVNDAKKTLSDAANRAHSEMKRVADETQKTVKKAVNTVDNTVRSAANTVKKSAQSTYKRAKKFFGF